MENSWYVGGGNGDNIRTMSRWYAYDWGWYKKAGLVGLTRNSTSYLGLSF